MQGHTLRYATPEMQADREVVMSALHSFPFAIAYASSDLQADREIVMRAVSLPQCGTLSCRSPDM